MNDRDNEIIETADKWQERNHERERLRIERAHERRKMIIGEIFDLPGLALLIFLSALSLLIFVDCEETVMDCSKADPDRMMERMKSECEGLESSSDRNACHQRMVEVLCESNRPGDGG